MEYDEAGGPTLELQVTALQARVADLHDNRANLAAIADWCATTYCTPGEDRAATVERTRDYLKDALITVTQQISASGAALSSFLDQQNAELQQVEAMMYLLENHLASQKQQLAHTATLRQFHRKMPQPRDDIAHATETAERPAVFRTEVCALLFAFVLAP